MTAGAWSGGWLRGVRRAASPNAGPRPRGMPVELIVVHSISLPPGEYGGDAVERLFTNQLDCDAHPYYSALRGLRVSAHVFIRRDGTPVQFVSCARRAWHAGNSAWRGRGDCNDYSIGIELEGLEGERFETSQMVTLSSVIVLAAARYPIVEVLGHEHIAPGRKADPGPRFDWQQLSRALSGTGVVVSAEVAGTA